MGKWIEEFLTNTTYDKRCKDAQKIRDKYEDRIPVIADVLNDADFIDEDNESIAPLEKNKFLVPTDLQVKHVQEVIKRHLTKSAEAEETFFYRARIMNNNGEEMSIPLNENDLISKVYDDVKGQTNEDAWDGYLYIIVMKEETLGF